MCASNPGPCACGCKGSKRKKSDEIAVSPASPVSMAPPIGSQIVYEVLDSPGSPLPTPLKGWLENRFHANLDHVRIHHDERAFEAAWEIHALAFTYSNHIVFGKAHFAPETSAGLRMLGHELAHVLQQTRSDWHIERSVEIADDDEYLEREADAAGQQLRLGTLGIDDGFRSHGGPKRIQLLGTTPGCSDGERQMIHQSIYNANSWVAKAIQQIEARPLTSKVLSSLRRNFGRTYGVAANAELIAGRLRRARSEMLRMPMSCNSTDTICATDLRCGFAVPGSLSTTICTNVTLAAGVTAVFRAGCILHESFHATFDRFTVDEYSGWHGHSGSSATYPGAGTAPLLNADSYTSLCMDLS